MTETAGKSGGKVVAAAVALTLRLPNSSALAVPEAETVDPLGVLPVALFVSLTNGSATAPESWLMVPMSCEPMSTPAMTKGGSGAAWALETQASVSSSAGTRLGC